MTEERCDCGHTLQALGRVRLCCIRCGARYERRPALPEWTIIRVADAPAEPK